MSAIATQHLDKPAAAPAMGLCALVQGRRTDYIGRLQRMDWAFERAEGQAYRKGKAELAALVDLQLELDRTAMMWDRFAKHQHPARLVRVILEHSDGARRMVWVKTVASLTAIAQHFSRRHDQGTRVDIEAVRKGVPS
jgi:hypothetical protein